MKPLRSAAELFGPDVKISHVVLPICDVSIASMDEEWIAIDQQKSSLVGTAFLIGGNGFAITAAHVIDQINNRGCVLSYDNERKARFFSIQGTERHPTEDVAIIKLEANSEFFPLSPFFVEGQKEFQRKRFDMWSYPEVVAKEIEFHGLPEEIWKIRPDLTFFSGYVHRRMSFSPNPSYSAYIGSTFFELSEVAGACASGSPIIGCDPVGWNVFAIYVGESTGQRKVGYAVSLEPIANWIPNILGKTIAEEARSTAQKY